ncbi:hypothetical protein ASD35_20250 [Pelomonas sp. Root1444]|nr:hypothetical protein ASD35_20250 [Pelomonas sp. Root1444]
MRMELSLPWLGQRRRPIERLEEGGEVLDDFRAMANFLWHMLVFLGGRSLVFRSVRVIKHVP